MADKLVKGTVTVSRVGVNSQGLSIVPGAPINPQLFNDLLNNKGYDVIWEKAMICPNRTQTPVSGEHDINCDLCNKSGFLYVDPIFTRMVIQGVSLKESYYIQGRFDGGRATVTSLSDNPISYWDRVTLRNGIVRFTELVRRREGTHVDLLKYTPIDVMIIVGGLGRQFRKNTDYRIEDNKIIWTKNVNARPADGDYVSVMYKRNPAYIILDLIKQHRDATDADGTHNMMPVQATAMLDFLVRDEAKDKAAIANPESPFSSESGN